MMFVHNAVGDRLNQTSEQKLECPGLSLLFNMSPIIGALTLVILMSFLQAWCANYERRKSSASSFLFFVFFSAA